MGTGSSWVASASLLLAAGVAALALSGCGDFWQDPYGTTNNPGGTAATTTTLTASPTTTTVGSDVTLTATVSASAATGTVTFYSNSTSVGSADLSSGTASTSYAPTSAGTDSLTASYSGDSTYAASTSAAVTVTVSASSSARAGIGGRVVADADPSNGPNPGDTQNRVATTAYEAAPIHATSAFSANDGVFTAKDAGAVVVEGKGAVTLTGAKLTAAAGNGRGVLLYQSGKNTGKPSFSMTGGSLSYTCEADLTPPCGKGSQSRAQNKPATLFSVANATAEIKLDDVTVANNTPTATSDNGTLLTAGAFEPWGANGANGGQVIFRAWGTALKGDVIVDGLSTAALSILADASGQGSTLTGAVHGAATARTVSLTLDPASLWIVTGNSHVTSLSGLDLDGKTVKNVDGGGHCIFYSGEINGQSSAAVYILGGGGYLAPRGTQGLACD